MKPKKPKFIMRAPEKKVIKKEEEGVEVKPPEKGKKMLQPLRGMHDRLPKEEKHWKKIFHTAESIAEYFQFGWIDTPILEEASLFTRSLGRGTDVIEKEMYVFEDRDGERICLRPEATASVVRAYNGHGLWNHAQPVKVWYWGPMFRHDRPQNGRYRQFYQIGFESLGVKDPAIDAELILMAYDCCKDLGLPVEVRINSLGTTEERVRYKTELLNYYRTKRSYLCENCRARLGKNPLRLLDCKEPGCQPVKEEAPQMVDWLGDESKAHFMKVLEYLDELSIPYLLTPSLVRGLDYYSHTVFELFLTDGDQGSQSALAAGGRYDLLAEELGGKPTPAAGVAIGVERLVGTLIERARANNTTAPINENAQPGIFFAQLGEEAKRRALRIIEDLRGSGLSLQFNFFKNSLKNQLEHANTVGAVYVLILGQKEVQDKTIIIRDMESGVQEVVDQKKLESALKRKLEKDMGKKG